MPNRSSGAGHIPVRTCVVCKKKSGKKMMIRFIFSGKDMIIDWKKKLSGRGYHVCDNNDCIVLLDKWSGKRLKTRKESSRLRQSI